VINSDSKKSDSNDDNVSSDDKKELYFNLSEECLVVKLLEGYF